MENIVRTEIPISSLEQGMTVEHNGVMITVSKHYIKYDPFMGWSFRGDASKRTITRVQFRVPTAHGFVLR